MSVLELQVADRFPAGTNVGAYPRIADFFTPGQAGPVSEARVQKDGTLRLTHLVEHGPYFLAAEIEEERPDASAPNGRREVKVWRSVAIVASNPAPAHDPISTNEQAAREADAAATVVSKTAIDTASAPGGAPAAPAPSIVEGARGTGNVLPERIEGQKKGTPLASHTATGEAVVVGDEPRKQEDISPRTKQSSDTELGSAAVIEELPRQEDVGSRTKQASDTETGTATTTEAHVPKPDAGDTTARETARIQDESSKAPTKRTGRKAAKKKASRTKKK